MGQVRLVAVLFVDDVGVPNLTRRRADGTLDSLASQEALRVAFAWARGILSSFNVVKFFCAAGTQCGGVRESRWRSGPR